jgi:hypothetical protein
MIATLGDFLGRTLSLIMGYPSVGLFLEGLVTPGNPLKNKYNPCRSSSVGQYHSDLRDFLGLILFIHRGLPLRSTWFLEWVAPWLDNEIPTEIPRPDDIIAILGDFLGTTLPSSRVYPSVQLGFWRGPSLARKSYTYRNSPV